MAKQHWELPPTEGMTADDAARGKFRQVVFVARSPSGQCREKKYINASGLFVGTLGGKVVYK